jgi:hypothetical protein
VVRRGISRENAQVGKRRSRWYLSLHLMKTKCVGGLFYFKGSYQGPLINLQVGFELNEINFLIDSEQLTPL